LMGDGVLRAQSPDGGACRAPRGEPSIVRPMRLKARKERRAMTEYTGPPALPEEVRPPKECGPGGGPG
jgi:hypothetical protein